MTLAITPTGATLGAIVTGVDLAHLGDAEWADIEHAFLTYAVLIFPSQHLSEAAQIGFGRRFGAIEQLVADREIVPISNQRADGTLLKDGEFGMQLMRGNEGWHTDSSYMPLAAKASVLSAHVVPSAGGQTEWADMRAAYDALDADLKAEIADLITEHSNAFSREQIGIQKADYGAENQEKLKPVRHRLVRHDARTGRASLYLSAHIGAIVGWPVPEGRMLARELTEHATQRRFVYAHEWKQWDLVIWDNRTTMHRARRYDDLHEVRDMRRTTIRGEGITVAQDQQAA